MAAQAPPLQPHADPLAAPLAQLAAHPSDDPLVLAARDQLVSLQRAARGLWRAAAPPPAHVGTAVRDAEGRLLGRLHVHGLDVIWLGRDGTAWRARLLPDQGPLPPAPRTPSNSSGYTGESIGGGSP